MDGILTPDFRGVVKTGDSAVILCSWHGYALELVDGARRRVGSITHVSHDDPYRRSLAIPFACGRSAWRTTALA